MCGPEEGELEKAEIVKKLRKMQEDFAGVDYEETVGMSDCMQGIEPCKCKGNGYQ
jgi:hypothetical protein